MEKKNQNDTTLKEAFKKHPTITIITEDENSVRSRTIRDDEKIYLMYARAIAEAQQEREKEQSNVYIDFNEELSADTRSEYIVVVTEQNGAVTFRRKTNGVHNEHKSR